MARPKLHCPRCESVAIVNDVHTAPPTARFCLNCAIETGRLIRRTKEATRP